MWRTHLNNFILKFKDVAVQPSHPDDSPVKRAVGFAGIDQALPLLDSGVLAPNPRAAKRNNVVKGILASLNEDPQLFRYKSKGLLISSHAVEPLERKRFRVDLSKPFVDGTLDGGHNLLAIGLHLLSAVMVDDGGAPSREWKRIADWEQFDAAWAEYKDQVEELVRSDAFPIDIAIELIFPSGNDADTMEAFDDAAFVISQARNTNTQVADEAFQNKLGFYEPLRANLPKELARRIEWKPGMVEDRDAKPIKVRDVIALAWIPLNVASEHKLLPLDISVSPQNIYRNKGECSEKFGELMRHDAVTEAKGGRAGAERVLINPAVESALQIAAELPRLMDDIYEAFPTLYNENGKRNFGRRKVVKMYAPDRIKELRKAGRSADDYTATKPQTPFFGESTPRMVHKYPEAFIYPILTALAALMKVEGGKVVWAVDNPRKSVMDKLAKIAPLYDGQLEAYQWDPQKIAKAASSHSQMRMFFEIM